MTNSIYTVYKTTNLINNKIYVGVHKTSNPNDSYLGSGIKIKRAINKHGKSNFNKIILFEYNNSYDAYLKESQIVTTSFVNDKNTYNIAIGGSGNSKPLYSTNNPNCNGKYSKIMWQNAPKIQHENQSKLCSKRNKLYWNNKENKNKLIERNINSAKLYKISNIISKDTTTIKGLSHELEKFCKEHMINKNGLIGAFYNDRIYKNEWIISIHSS